MSEIIPTTIIGGGVIGCAIAFELSKKKGGNIVIIEKNDKIRAENQSSRNSGVIHAGIYYSKDETPIKASMCIRGNRLLYEFCDKYDVPSKKTGKIIVATNLLEEVYLDEVLKIARENRIPGVVKIKEEEIKNYEPNVKGIVALFVPTSGIIEPVEFVMRLNILAESQGALFVTGNEVIGISSTENYFIVTTKSGNLTESFKTKILINSAGLYSDKIAKLVNPDCPYEIEPVRGESSKFYKNKRNEILTKGMNVYPVPFGYYNDTGKQAIVTLNEYKRLLSENILSKTVGAHLTPTFDYIDGKHHIGNTVTIGPIKSVGFGKKDCGSGLKSKEIYAGKVKHFFPNLREDDILLHQAGIMATVKEHPDFIIERDKKYPNCINLIGIDSPGLTASLSIAKYVRRLLRDELSTTQK